jgi:hypothetical protein
MFYNPTTDKVYKDARAVGIQGLSADNCGAHGLVVPEIEDKPTLTPIQRATLDATPTNINGTWVRKWTTTTIPAAQIKLSRAQFAISLAGAGIITASEAEAWAANGELPTFASDAIANSGMSATEQMGARIKAKAAVEIDRTSPIVTLLQASLSLTDAQVDALFVAGAVL